MELRNYIKVYDDIIPPQTLGNMIRWFNTCEFKSGVIGHGVLDKNIRNVQTKPLTNLGKSLTETHWCNLLNRFFTPYSIFVGSYNLKLMTKIIFKCFFSSFSSKFHFPTISFKGYNLCKRSASFNSGS